MARVEFAAPKTPSSNSNATKNALKSERVKALSKEAGWLFVLYCALVFRYVPA